MADTWRNVKMSFWEDEKVVEMFSPEDKYFFLYLLTNPHTNQLGIYRLLPKKAAFETGYSPEVIMVLLDRFENKYRMLKYSRETNEVAIANFLVHSIIRGGDVIYDNLVRASEAVQNKSLLVYIYNNIYNKKLNNTVIKYIDYLQSNITITKKEEYKNGYEAVTEHVTMPVTESVTLPLRENRKKEDIDAFFETCWKAYPRKEGKGSVSDTKKAELYSTVGLEQMLRCIDRYVQKHGNDGEFIKHGSTFFNSGYVDYLDENYGSAPMRPEQKEGSGVWQ